MIRPLHDRVIVQQEAEEGKTKGGIIIPDTAKERPLIGRVIAAGEGRRGKNGSLQPLAVKAGDNVLFGRYAGTEVELDGRKYLVMREDDILGVIE
ncbi:MAG: co-chaperone GroES [Pseudomonadota bacterium]